MADKPYSISRGVRDLLAKGAAAVARCWSHQRDGQAERRCVFGPIATQELTNPT